MPVFLVILWQHRWLASLQAGMLFVALNLLWFVPMLRDNGGWFLYRQASAEFAYKAGYLNSYWHLGFIDAPVRYMVKGGMALVWTLGPGLLFVPRGLWRLRRTGSGGFLAMLLVISVLPALGSHLLVHFGVPGYAFHYVPAIDRAGGAGDRQDCRAVGRARGPLGSVSPGGPGDGPGAGLPLLPDRLHARACAVILIWRSPGIPGSAW